MHNNDVVRYLPKHRQVKKIFTPRFIIDDDNRFIRKLISFLRQIRARIKLPIVYRFPSIGPFYPIKTFFPFIQNITMQTPYDVLLNILKR